MPSRYTLFLPNSLYAALVDHARSAQPHECCGLLAGVPGGWIIRAQRYFPLINAADQPDLEFLSEPRSMFAAVKAMRTDGLDIVAVFHSHPTTAPIPSRKDCARNYSESVLNLIMSMRQNQPCLRGWWLTEDGFEEGGLGICGI